MRRVRCGAALRVLELGLLSGGGEVPAQRVELGRGLGFVDGLDALLELVGADPAGAGVLVEGGHDSLAVLIGDPQLARLGPDGDGDDGG